MAKKISTKKTAPQLTDRIGVVSLLDRFSTYPSRGLTPERLASLLREADAGDIYRQSELAEEMYEKDAYLFSLVQSRNFAVTSRPSQILPFSESPKDIRIAAEAASMLSRIKGWDNAKKDMLDGDVKGFAVLNQEWDNSSGKYEIKKLEWIHQKRFRWGKFSDLNSDPSELRLLVHPFQIESYRGLVPYAELANAVTEGIALDCDPTFRKRFVVFLSKARSGNPSRTGLIRSVLWPFLFKNYDVKWWIQFAEIQLGYRIGKYDRNQPDQIDLLKRALAGLSTDSAAVISKDSDIEFKEMLQKGSSHQVYSEVKDYCHQEYANALLGHTGSSQSTPGKLGSENAALEAKHEIVAAVAHTLDETITDQTLRVWVDLNYGPNENCPYHKTDVEPPADLDALATTLLKVQQIGYPIGKKYVKERFGIPLPDPNDKDDEVLVPRTITQPTPFPGKDSVAGKMKLLMKR